MARLTASALLSAASRAAIPGEARVWIRCRRIRTITAAAESGRRGTSHGSAQPPDRHRTVDRDPDRVPVRLGPHCAAPGYGAVAPERDAPGRRAPGPRPPPPPPPQR